MTANQHTTPRWHLFKSRRGFALLATAALALATGGLYLRDRTLRTACDEPGHSACALPAGHAAALADPRAGELPVGAAVVELTSEACPACRKMAPVLRDAKSKCAAAGATLVDLDVESVNGGALATRLQVTETPTVVLFDAEHNELARLIGSKPLAEVTQVFERAYGIACSAGAAPRSSGG